MLCAIYERARALGCDYVLFDADAPMLEGLLVFEEEAEDKAGISPLQS